MPPRKKQASKRKKEEESSSEDEKPILKKGKKEKKDKQLEQDWSLVDIDATIRRFNELDQEILKLEEERQQALMILKSHPQTLVQYSTVNRYEKTKESLQSKSFYSLGSDCLTLIFDFAFARQVVEAPFVIKLFGMTTKIREALLHSNFILGIAQPNYKFRLKSMPIFTGLYGLELVISDDCLALARHLLDNGSRFNSLVIRDDISYSKHDVPEVLKRQIKSIQHFGPRGSLMGKTKAFDSFTSLEHFSSLVFGRAPKWPNVKSLIITGPTTESISLYGSQLENLELLAIICPSCKSSRSTFKDESLFGYIKAKYFISARFVSKSKKPDLLAISSFSIKIYEKVEGLDDDAPKLSKYLPLPESISFSSHYREVFEKLEGIQHHTDNTKNLIGYLKSQFNE